MMSPAEKAAFIAAQTQMMIAERDIMVAENIEREDRGVAMAHGPDEWERFRQAWEPVLGYNALTVFFHDA